MTYATTQDLVDRFGFEEICQLTDRDHIGLIDDVVIEKALRGADAEIDAYVSSRYALPLQHVPMMLKRIAEDVARYHLYELKAPEHITERYKDAVKFLINVSRGTVSLGADENNQQSSGTSGIKSVSPSRVFSANTLRDY